MRTVLYTRYSAGPRQTDQSIEGQIRVCTEYCKQNNLTITEIYADRHISGKTDERPEFQRLIADAKKKKFDAVCVYKTDRFARNKYDSAIYKRQLKNLGIKIFYAAEAIPDGPEGIILESLMEGLAEYYSAELAQKIRRGMHESALRCKVLGRTLPFGYRVSTERTYEIDPETEPAVIKIFDMYIKGAAYVDICNWLNTHGFKTSTGGEFNKNSIGRIIKNEKYIGIYQHGDVRVEDGVPAIISKEVFYLAQKETERRKTSKSSRHDTARYLLSGKLFCGYCKKAMQGVSGTGKSGKKFYYYQCATARKKGACPKEHVNRDYIENAIVWGTYEYVTRPEIIKDLAHKIYLRQNDQSKGQTEIKIYRKKLNENKKAISNIVAAVEKGLGTNSLLERLESLEAERIALEGEIAYLKTLSANLSEGEICYQLMQYLRPNDEDWDNYKERVIKTFVKKVYLYNDKSLVYYTITETDEAIEIELAEEFDTSPARSIKES